MTTGYVQVAPDSSGKQLDNDVVIIPAGTQISDNLGNITTLSAPAYYFRERITNADPTNPSAIASVKGGTGPNVGEFGLTVNMPGGQADNNTLIALLMDIDANIAALAGNPPLAASLGATPQAQSFALPVSGALPSAQMSGTVPRAEICDKYGRRLVVPQVMRELVGSQETTITTTTETAITPVFGDQVTVADIIAIIACNTSATAVRVDIRDQLSTVVAPSTLMNGVIPIYLPAGDMRGISLGGVLIPQSNTGQTWTATVSSSVTDIRIWAMYAKNLR